MAWRKSWVQVPSSPLAVAPASPKPAQAPARTGDAGEVAGGGCGSEDAHGRNQASDLRAVARDRTPDVEGRPDQAPRQRHRVPGECSSTCRLSALHHEPRVRPARMEVVLDVLRDSEPL